ncbi:hypothetical protein JJV70_20325 [Streptomyces sp. JJ66]|uniref:hypothetical protein n=1 Tax=Streptomyces sp. JJ66 TaxID=2803843 RepID=UPI001C58876E|nr:hypothetical protein [Streptomyces sp. JJ66]MBW1604405.1 hypothetical protein [Streptomyces sp. JJ66]
MTAFRKTAAAERIRAAEDVAEELRGALRAAGVTLPSLRLDPVSCAREEPWPLVDLGCCNQETAARLAAALRAGAAR